jgi:VanZ family protein
LDPPLPLAVRFRILVAARITFTLACLVVGYGVFKPAGGSGPSLLPWDKAEHFTAFFGLMFLALIAFPRTLSWRLGLLLSAAGAAIEVIQATPLVHRDAEIMDWVADSVGIAAVVGVIMAARLRRSLTRLAVGQAG